MLPLFFLVTISLGLSDENPALHSRTACLDCLAKARPLNKCDNNTGVGKEVCGNFHIEDRFFQDCSAYLQGNSNFHACALDPDCSKKCVRAYWEKYEPLCAPSSSNKKELSCFEYAIIHADGAIACMKNPSAKARQLLENMTSVCGCETVYNGPCPTKPPDGNADALIIYIVSAVCGGVLVALTSITVLCCLLYHRRNRRNFLDLESTSKDKKTTGNTNQQKPIDSNSSNTGSQSKPDIRADYLKPNSAEVSINNTSVNDRSTPIEESVNNNSSLYIREGSGKENEYEQTLQHNTSYVSLVDLVKVNSLTNKNVVSPGNGDEGDDMYTNKTAIDYFNTNYPTLSRAKKPPIPEPREVYALGVIPEIYENTQMCKGPTAIYVQDVTCDDGTDRA